jgi:hypothetical protein
MDEAKKSLRDKLALTGRKVAVSAITGATVGVGVVLYYKYKTNHTIYIAPLTMEAVDFLKTNGQGWIKLAAENGSTVLVGLPDKV